MLLYVLLALLIVILTFLATRKKHPALTLPQPHGSLPILGHALKVNPQTASQTFVEWGEVFSVLFLKWKGNAREEFRDQRNGLAIGICQRQLQGSLAKFAKEFLHS